MSGLKNIIDDATRLFSGLLALQKGCHDQIIQQEPAFSNEELDRHYQKGEIFLNMRLPELNEEILSQLREDLCCLIARYRSEKSAEIDRINAFLAGNPQVFHDFLKNRDLNLPEESPCQDRELLDFILCQTMRPFLQRYAEGVMPFYKEDRWVLDYCPVCGQKAYFSYLRREDGKRVLVCPLCGTEWIYRYLSCPWCGNANHQDIKFFEVAEVPGYEVYVCEKCRGYQKTYNAKKGVGHDDWMLEDIKTLALDMIAMREGYARQGQKLLQ